MVRVLRGGSGDWALEITQQHICHILVSHSANSHLVWEGITLGALGGDIIGDELDLRGDIRVGDSLRWTLELRVGVNQKMIERR